MPGKKNIEFRSSLSFGPLVKVWKESTALNTSAAGIFCNQLLEKFSAYDELMKPVDDYHVLDQHKHLIEEAMVSIFPPSRISREDLYVVAAPFSNRVIHASPLFSQSFVNEKNNYAVVDPQVQKNIADSRINLAFKLILKKFYNIELPGHYSFICAYPDPAENIKNYFELKYDARFIDVFCDDDLPELPPRFKEECRNVKDLTKFPELADLLQLEKFVFEGMIIGFVNEVTEREVALRVRKMLDTKDLLEQPETLVVLKDHLSHLLQIPDLQLRINSITDQQKPERLDENNWSVLTTVLEYTGVTIGSLELYTAKPNSFENSGIWKLQPIIELLQMALKKSQQNLQHRIDQLVKTHFTAVHSSVEWKFNEAAHKYLSNMQEGKDSYMDSIKLEDVYPLYGIIDIKNSSSERNLAFQKDLEARLIWIKNIIESAEKQVELPIIREILQRIKTYIGRVNTFLFSAEEQEIFLFLNAEVSEILKYIQETVPQLDADVQQYFDAVENAKALHKFQKKFEESVAEINNQVIHFLDREQKDAQNIYPHYFERFVTDGVDMNLYIGQSICPDRKFNNLFLQNIRLWQLSFLSTAARMIDRFAVALSYPLQTTQIILAYNEPISISFRTAERKFDVIPEHVRYEIIKKRIDKVHIKNTNERLSKVGNIAIVYLSHRQESEYVQYIEYLRKQELLIGEVEKLELEELHGVSGLKALRVGINFSESKSEKQLSDIRITDQK